MVKEKQFFDKWKTMQYQLTVRFITVLVVAVLLLSTAITLMTSLAIYDATKKQTKLLVSSLMESKAESSHEWKELLETHIPNDNSPNFIRVVLKSGEVVYSEEAENLYQEFPSFTHFFFAKRLLWDDDFDPYYYRTVEKNGASISVLVEMEDSFDIIGDIVFFTVLLTLIVIIIGGLMTYRFAKKISRSLTRMNSEIMTLTTSQTEGGLLTEPDSPIEVANISSSFNQLITEQRASMRREKQFVTDASHELRTPLTAIRGHVNLIKRRGEKHPEIIPTSLNYLDKESKRMEGLVEQLLTLGRHEKGHDSIDFSNLVYETVAEFQLIHSQQIELHLEEEIILIGSYEHYYQIIRNLLENALKYSHSDDQVEVTLALSESDVLFCVTDTGIGISDEDKPHIFERFYRADQSRSSLITGSGIGLSLVKELVEGYGGVIEVADNVPKGTCFSIKFPLS